MPLSPVARLWPLTLLALVGCGKIDDLREQVNGLTNPLVGQGLVLGVQPPDASTGIDLTESNFGRGAWAELYLADAASVDDMSSAPVTGASAALQSASNGTLDLEETAEGRYTVDDDAGLVYSQEATTLSVTLEDGDHTMTVVAPAVADAAISPSHTVGAPLSIDLSGQGFDSVVVVVFDAATMEVTFSNEPEDISALYTFTHGGNGDVVEVPADAFMSQTLYAVAVAGLVNAEAEDMGDLNTALSGMTAGKFRFYPVSTRD